MITLADDTLPVPGLTHDARLVLATLALLGGSSNLGRVAHAGLSERAVRHGAAALVRRGYLVGVRRSALVYASRLRGAVTLTEAGRQLIQATDRGIPVASTPL